MNKQTIYNVCNITNNNITNNNSCYFTVAKILFYVTSCFLQNAETYFGVITIPSPPLGGALGVQFKWLSCCVVKLVGKIRRI